MKDFPANNCSIEVEQGRVVVNMEGRKSSEQAEVKDFADVPLTESAVVEGALFYVAKNAKNEVKRCVSATINDRKAVAALVAGWIAEGFVVESMGVREFKKQIVIIEKAEKEIKEAREAVAAELASIPQEPSAEKLPLPELMLHVAEAEPVDTSVYSQ